MTLTILASLVGRVLLVGGPSLAGWFPVVIVALTLMALGAGLLQTAVYAAVKQSTDEATSAVGFSLIYALMNLGIVIESAISSPVRAAYGTTGVFAMCTALTLVYLVVHLVGLPADAGRPVVVGAKP